MPRPATGLNTASRRRPDGSTEYRWYHRSSGLFIGSSVDGWTKEAATERARDLDAGTKAGPPSGSFGELCVLYLSSPKFKKRAPKTRKGYTDHIDVLRGMWEAVPVTYINRKAVSALHARYEDRPWQGNAILRTLRLIINYAIKLELPGLVKNPVSGTELYETPPRTQIWDEPRIEAFLSHAEPRLRLAFALLLYTVQRPSDMLTFSRPMMFQRDGRDWIRLRQAKTDALVDVPCHHVLVREMKAAEKATAADLAHADARRGSGQPTRLSASNLLVASPTGKPWSYRNFARSWDIALRRTNWTIAREAIQSIGRLPRRKEARAAAKATIRARLLNDVQRRDLRRTGVVQLALAGATVPQIAALAGWQIDHTQKIVDTYLPRRGEVALGGVQRWENSDQSVVVLPRAPRASK